MKLMRANKEFLVALAAVATAFTTQASTIVAKDAFWEVNGQGSLQAPFGDSATSDYYKGLPSLGDTFNTLWPVGTTWHVSKTVDFTGFDLSTITYSLGIDNDADLFLNGVQVGDINHDGVAYLGDFTGALTGLTSGNNTISLDIKDRGVASFFAMEISGDRLQTVPDAGASAGLLGLGLLGLWEMKRRIGAAK